MIKVVEFDRSRERFIKKSYHRTECLASDCSSSLLVLDSSCKLAN